MNKVILIGRLTKDPEVRQTQTGKKVASISIAVDDGKDSSGQKLTQYFNGSCWEQQAEIVERYVKKGHRICIVGKLQNRSWDKPDGTKGYATDVLIREIEILTSKNEAETIASSQNYSSNSQNSSNQSQKSNDSDDIPEIDIDSINVQMPF